MHSNFNDLAIILTWPDATIRGDEQWMMFFKKIGLVKNLNFKVGHTGIILVNPDDGMLLFYDFGRYITPRGYGRARSQLSDPLVAINIKAILNNGKIDNIEDIIIFLETLKPAMYGEGKLLFTIVEGINYKLAKAYGDHCVLQGTYPYGALAKNNNNCSRFITRMLMKASKRFHHLHSINFPETLKSSPISNLINAVPDRKIYSYTPEEGIVAKKMNRFQSLWFLIKQLGDNVFKHKAALLPDDRIIGAMQYHTKPTTVPSDALYLGGVGDGAWYTIHAYSNEHLLIKRYTSTGILEYIAVGEATQQFDVNTKFDITYDSHKLFTHVIQNNIKICISHIEQLQLTNTKLKNVAIAQINASLLASCHY
mgnify:CR=1 FL=1